MADHHHLLRHQSSSSSCSDAVTVSITDWDSGLPSDDLTPLSTPLLPPSLSAAFSVSPEPSKTVLDVHLAAVETLATLCRRGYPPPPDKLREASFNEEEALEGSSSSRSQKRRLVWTPQLHKRFLDVIARLGSKDAVPKKDHGDDEC